MNRMQIASGTFLSALLLCACAMAAEKKPADWKPLMDGTTLAGWHPVGAGKWTVEDGAIVGRADKEKLYGYLATDKTFKDFTARFKFKVVVGDSGFFIRTRFEEPDMARGLQVQVGRLKSGVGGIYESYGRGWLVKPTDEAEKSYTRDDQWNEMVIDARGGHVKVTVNGVTSADLRDDKLVKDGGCLALQMHSQNVMHVMFKDIEILE